MRRCRKFGADKNRIRRTGGVATTVAFLSNLVCFQAGVLWAKQTPVWKDYVAYRGKRDNSHETESAGSGAGIDLYVIFDKEQWLLETGDAMGVTNELSSLTRSLVSAVGQKVAVSNGEYMEHL